MALITCKQRRAEGEGLTLVDEGLEKTHAGGDDNADDDDDDTHQYSYTIHKYINIIIY